MSTRTFLQKLSCLLLACAMVCGLLSVSGPVVRAAEPADGTPAASLADEAVRVIGLLGVMKGYTDGSIGEGRPLTRAEGAALVSRMCWGGDDDSELFLDGNPGGYTDLEGHWAIGYINYCTVRGLFSGTGNGLASPDRPVRTVEFYKLCLTALGYLSDREGFLGKDWDKAVIERAASVGLSEGVTSALYGSITRRDAALVLFHLLSCGLVAYDRIRANVIYRDGAPLTFGEEILGITTVAGVLAANGMAKLAGVNLAYQSLSPEPNGITTVGGVVQTEDGRAVELNNVSPALSMLGCRVFVTLSEDLIISIADAGTNVIGGVELLPEKDGAPVLPAGCQVYVNYRQAEDGQAELDRAVDTVERIVTLSNDGDSEPEYVFIDRWEYIGRLQEISTASYPGQGRSYRFDRCTRYEKFIIGSCPVGDYARIRQVGRYCFLDRATRGPGDEGTDAGVLALLTGISIRSEGNVRTVDVYVVPEEGERGVRRVEGLSIDGRVYRLDELTGSERAVAEVLTGRRLDDFRNGTASGLHLLIGLLPGAEGGVILSPSFDGVRDRGVPGQLTVYAGYQAGDISFGLGADGRERYLDSRSVFFLEGEDGWVAYRGNIPTLQKALGQQFIDVWYANMFEPEGSDELYLRAAVITQEQMGVDMQGEYEFLLVLSVGEPRQDGRRLLKLFDGYHVREVLTDGTAVPGEILRGMRVSEDGTATLDRSSYATGSFYSGKSLSFGANILVLEAGESNLVFDYAGAKCYIIDGEKCSDAESKDLIPLAGCRTEVIGRNYGRANLVFVFK